jgi:hypothetical protein
VPRLCELYPGSCLTTEGAARKNLSHGSGKYQLINSRMKTAYMSIRINRAQMSTAGVRCLKLIACNQLVLSASSIGGSAVHIRRYTLYNATIPRFLVSRPIAADSINLPPRNATFAPTHTPQRDICPRSSLHTHCWNLPIAVSLSEASPDRR